MEVESFDAVPLEEEKVELTGNFVYFIYTCMHDQQEHVNLPYFIQYNVHTSIVGT
jgi:hypothetical protein